MARAPQDRRVPAPGPGVCRKTSSARKVIADARRVGEAQGQRPPDRLRVAGLEDRGQQRSAIGLLASPVRVNRGTRRDVRPLELVRLVAGKRDAERDPTVLPQVAQDPLGAGRRDEDGHRLAVVVDHRADGVRVCGPKGLVTAPDLYERRAVQDLDHSIGNHAAGDPVATPTACRAFRAPPSRARSAMRRRGARSVASNGTSGREAGGNRLDRLTPAGGEPDANLVRTYPHMIVEPGRPHKIRALHAQGSSGDRLTGAHGARREARPPPGNARSPRTSPGDWWD